MAIRYAKSNDTKRHAPVTSRHEGVTKEQKRHVAVTAHSEIEAKISEAADVCPTCGTRLRPMTAAERKRKQRERERQRD